MCRNYVNVDGLRISLPEQIYDQIITEVAKYYPRECGGIFVGSIDISNSTAVIEQMLIPQKVKSTRILFRRFASGINKALSEIFNQTQGQQYYLGEWHSHPNALPMPSGKDIRTMKGIVNNGNIRINTPLLLIVGYQPGIVNEQFYIFSNNNFTNYEQEGRA